MSITNQYVQDELIERWLRNLFYGVEEGRLYRGRVLYQEEALLDFEENKGGFTAIVQGSRPTPYEVTGVIQERDLEGFPLFNQFTLSCTCPDEVDICKHSVCAVIHLAVYMDQKQVADEHNGQKPPRLSQKTPSLAKTRRKVSVELKQMERQLEQLEGLAKSSPHSIQTLGSASFWPFKTDLEKVMGDVHHVVRKSLR